MQCVTQSVTARFVHAPRRQVTLDPGDLLEGIETSSTFEIRRAWCQGERWEAPARSYLSNSEALASLPPDTPERLVKTHSLYHGDLFLAEGKLYLVIGTAADGSRLAKPWANLSTQIVTLDRHSLLAQAYPVVELGEPLPIYLKRNDLLDHQSQPMHFKFANEALAFRAACLDQSLTYRAVLFAHSHDATTYVLSDGRQPYRYYSYPARADRSEADRPGPTDWPLPQSNTLDYTEGPLYWRFLVA